jgi:hypothetical protein
MVCGVSRRLRRVIINEIRPVGNFSFYLDNHRLPHTRLAHQDQVVLPALQQDLGDFQHLLPPPDQRRQSSRRRHFNDLREIIPANPSVFLQMQTVPLEAAHLECGHVLFPIPSFDLAPASPSGLNLGVRFGGRGCESPPTKRLAMTATLPPNRPKRPGRRRRMSRSSSTEFG